jgi:hypothetical protein
VPGIYAREEEATEHAWEDEDFLTSQAGNNGGVALSLKTVSRHSHSIKHSSLHQDFKCSMFFKLSRAPAIRMQHLRSRGLDVLSTEQLVHRRTGGVHGIENHEIARPIAMAFESDDSNGMTGLLEING